MQFIANYWWLWMILSVCCWVYCFFNQLKRMKEVASTSRSNLFDIKKSFFSGQANLIIFGLSGSMLGLLLLIEVVLNIIRYAKG